MGDAFIKLYRKLINWEWYDDTNTLRVFLHCLLKANWKPCKWHGVCIEAGQFITSLATLADETHLSIMQVRTAINHLISTGEITSYQQGKYRVITVNSWSQYQGDNKVNNKVVTRLQQGDNKVVTTDKEYKEIKNDKKRGFNPPTLEEVIAYAEKRGNKVDPHKFYDYYTAGNWIDGKGNPVKMYRSSSPLIDIIYLTNLTVDIISEFF